MRAEPFALQPDGPVFLESYTLRTLALSRDLIAIPADVAQRDALETPYQLLAATALLAPLEGIAPRPVSLVILCRPHELEALEDLPLVLSAAFDDIVLVIDGGAVDGGGTAFRPSCHDAVRLVARPLAGDFAAQRNAGQDVARHDWVLQLDSDEALTPEALSSIGRVAALADETGALSIGLPRQNLVDGRLSDLFPDIQYRLNRKTVRFAGLVHERPALPRGWRDGFIAPNLVIEHRLTRTHVEARSAGYDALAPGQGRMFERDDLLKPYRP
ncbi:MAG: hypothetical protein KAG89_02115 [Fulvimarina manganoxydans]|nr:hypothetical protein [Fulvimarina manganoxydans]